MSHSCQNPLQWKQWNPLHTPHLSLPAPSFSNPSLCQGTRSRTSPHLLWIITQPLSSPELQMPPSCPCVKPSSWPTGLLHSKKMTFQRVSWKINILRLPPPHPKFFSMCVSWLILNTQKKCAMQQDLFLFLCVPTLSREEYKYYLIDKISREWSTGIPVLKYHKDKILK